MTRVTASSVGAAARATEKLVLIAGNPNVGKTTLYNHLTHENATVSNYAGVTVERRVAPLDLGKGATRALLADLPGTYSLSASSKDEQVAIDACLGLAGNPRPDLCIVVVNAGQVTRNLYLVLQLVELQIPLIVALNMIDEAGPHAIGAARISEAFGGIPCVATNGHTKQGVDELNRTIARALLHPPQGLVAIDYASSVNDDVTRVSAALPKAWQFTAEQTRALSLWALTSIDTHDELEHIPGALREAVLDVAKRAAHAGRDLDLEIIGARYRFLERVAEEPVPSSQVTLAPARAARASQPPASAASSLPPALTARIDGVLLHPAFGFVIFVGLMLLLFQALFSWADPAIGVIEAAFGGLQGLALSYLPDGFLRDLLVEGLLGGVGNVVVFLPQIMLLFLFIGLLESSGYMARVAYLMDRVMKSVGLHGRAFIPMLSGLACAVPAVMATRTMERERDRILTMMVVPLMSCSARLPVYGLVIAALFPPTAVFGWIPIQGLLMTFMYVFSLITALLAASVLGRTTLRGRRVPLLLELPPYRIPSVKNALNAMWGRSRVFLSEAGTVILGFTVVLWLLASYPKPSASERAATSPEQAQAAALERSYAGQLGHAIEPVLRPLGFDWKIGVGIIGAFAAREVFVSTMGLVYGVGAVEDEATEPLRDKLRDETRADGSRAYTPLVGLSLMVFFALACQCMSTLAAVKRETRSWRWPSFLFVYMTALAWVASFLVYQGGKLLGFG